MTKKREIPVKHKGWLTKENNLWHYVVRGFDAKGRSNCSGFGWHDLAVAKRAARAYVKKGWTNVSIEGEPSAGTMNKFFQI